MTVHESDELAARRRALGGYVFRTLEVLRAERLTPRMRRITFGGEEIAGFGEDRDGPNVKVYLPRPGQDRPRMPVADGEGGLVWPPDDEAPIRRTYTVLRHRPEAGEIDIDFLLHGHGVAGVWAANAEPGDLLGFTGPGGKTVRPADWTLLVADHCGLPALAKLLETRPADARGQAIIAVPGPEERRPLTHPDGYTVEWLYTGDASPAEPVIDAALRAPWPDTGSKFTWVSAESEIVRTLRSHARTERGLDRRSTLCIGYWRRGMTENQYDAAFLNDRDMREAAAG